MSDTKARLEQCNKDIAKLRDERFRLEEQLEKERRSTVRHGNIMAAFGNELRIVMYDTTEYRAVDLKATDWAGANSENGINDLIQRGIYEVIGNIFDLSVEELRECFARHARKEG